MAGQWSRWSEDLYGRLSRFLLLTYSAFLAGFFFVPNAVDLYKFYSIAVLLPALILFSRTLPLLRGDRLFLLVLLYLVYMLITPAWGESFQWRPYVDYLRLALYVLAFLGATVLLYHMWPERHEIALRAVSLLAGIAGLVSLAIWFSDAHPSSARLIGIGILRNPNASGYAHAVFGVVNLAYAMIPSGKVWLRIGHLLAAAVLFWFVLLTHSRGALLAGLAGIITLFIGRRAREIFLFALLLVVVFMAVHFYFPQVYSALDRGIGARPDIWKVVWSQIREAPFLGHGYLVDPSVYVEGRRANFSFAHNAYLATLRDGGIIGGLLLLAFLGEGFRRAFQLDRNAATSVHLALLVLASICMLFDTDRLLTRPRELWLVLWLPLGLLMAHSSLLRVSKEANH